MSLTLPPIPKQPEPIEVFLSYSHKNKALVERLRKHLTSLEQENKISGWYDRNMTGGIAFDEEVKKHLESAGIILLLVSEDFMASDYINSVELKRAMERHEDKNAKARVVPVILQPVDWQKTPFGKLVALPTDGKPVTNWTNRAAALLDIAQGIRRVVDELNKTP